MVMMIIVRLSTIVLMERVSMMMISMHEAGLHGVSFVVQCDFLQLTSDLLSLIVLFPYML